MKPVKQPKYGDKNPKSKLQRLNAVIQICPVCGKVDAYKNDGHDCYAMLNRMKW